MENEDENDDIHGNSKNSKKLQHLYEIVDSEFEETIKFGISGSELNKNNSSKRANSQVNALNKIWGWTKYYANVLFMKIQGRKKALELENKIVKKYKQEHVGNLPPEQKRPNPEIE